MEAVTTSLSLKPENLPPTVRAIFFHALCVHLQVVRWKLLDVNCLNPLEWGSKTTDAGLEPVNADLDTALENLLQFIRCKCKLSSKILVAPDYLVFQAWITVCTSVWRLLW